jgi:hypothetical protein
LFYETYTPIFQSQPSTNLINNAKYEEIVSLLQTNRTKKEDAKYRKWRDIYKLIGNVAGYCLFQTNTAGDLKTVPRFEAVFDIICQAHSKLGHSKGMLV